MRELPVCSALGVLETLFVVAVVGRMIPSTYCSPLGAQRGCLMGDEDKERREPSTSRHLPLAYAVVLVDSIDRNTSDAYRD